MEAYLVEDGETLGTDWGFSKASTDAYPKAESIKDRTCLNDFLAKSGYQIYKAESNGDCFFTCLLQWLQVHPLCETAYFRNMTVEKVRGWACALVAERWHEVGYAREIYECINTNPSSDTIVDLLTAAYIKKKNTVYGTSGTMGTRYERAYEAFLIMVTVCVLPYQRACGYDGEWYKTCGWDRFEYAVTWTILDIMRPGETPSSEVLGFVMGLLGMRLHVFQLDRTDPLQWNTIGHIRELSHEKRKSTSNWSVPHLTQCMCLFFGSNDRSGHYELILPVGKSVEAGLRVMAARYNTVVRSKVDLQNMIVKQVNERFKQYEFTPLPCTVNGRTYISSTYEINRDMIAETSNAKTYDAYCAFVKATEPTSALCSAGIVAVHTRVLYITRYDMVMLQIYADTKQTCNTSHLFMYGIIGQSGDVYVRGVHQEKKTDAADTFLGRVWVLQRGSAPTVSAENLFVLDFTTTIMHVQSHDGLAYTVHIIDTRIQEVDASLSDVTTHHESLIPIGRTIKTVYTDVQNMWFSHKESAMFDTILNGIKAKNSSVGGLVRTCPYTGILEMVIKMVGWHDRIVRTMTVDDDICYSILDGRYPLYTVAAANTAPYTAVVDWLVEECECKDELARSWARRAVVRAFMNSIATAVRTEIPTAVYTVRVDADMKVWFDFKYSDVSEDVCTSVAPVTLPGKYTICIDGVHIDTHHIWTFSVKEQCVFIRAISKIPKFYSHRATLVRIADSLDVDDA